MTSKRTEIELDLYSFFPVIPGTLWTQVMTNYVCLVADFIGDDECIVLPWTLFEMIIYTELETDIPDSVQANDIIREIRNVLPECMYKVKKTDKGLKIRRKR